MVKNATSDVAALASEQSGTKGHGLRDGFRERSIGISLLNEGDGDHRVTELTGASVARSTTGPARAGPVKNNSTCVGGNRLGIDGLRLVEPTHREVARPRPSPPTSRGAFLHGHPRVNWIPAALQYLTR